MKSKKFLIIIILFIITFLLSTTFFIKSVKGLDTDTIEYNVQKITPYTSYSGIDKTNVNLRHSNDNTYNFNASSTFDRPFDIYPYNWITETGGGGSLVGRQELLGNHAWVMFLTDSSATGYPYAQQIWYNKESGTFEFFIRTTDATYESEVKIIGNLETTIFGIRIDDDEFQYYDGSWNNIGITAHSDIWFHIRIDFDCTNIGYLGLSQDTWKLYIDDTDFIYGMNGNPTWAKWVLIDTNTADNGYTTFIDGVGYSWDSSYTIGSNIIPIIEQENYNILKPDKYEFTLDGNGVPNNITDNPSIPFWNRNSEAHVYLSNDSYSYNFGVKIKGKTDTSQLYKTISLENDMINITFSLSFLTMNDLNSYFVLSVNSLNNTEILRLRILTLTSTSFRLQYYDGADYQNLDDITGINLKDILEFNLYIDDFKVRMFWLLDSIYQDSYTFDLMLEAKGIYNIYFYGLDSVGDENFYETIIDYIGIYQYDISITNEVGYISNDLEIYELLSNVYNLNIINCNDPLKIILSNTWSNNHYYEVFDQKILRNGFISEAKTINTYDWSYSIITSRLILMTNERIDLNDYSFSIEGVWMYESIEGVYIDGYIPTYFFSGVSENKSYFYVDGNNKLRFTMNFEIDGTFEGMIIYFEIDNRYTMNKTIAFRQYYNNIGNGTFILRLTHLFFPEVRHYLVPYVVSYDILIFPQSTIYRTIELYIHDSNDDGNTGLSTSGYIADIKVRDINRPIEISSMTLVLTLNLITIMIPIIIIFIPTLAIYFIYGKKSIIPMLILMSIICVITSLIPMEIFFIIIFSLGCSLLIQYRKRGNE